MAQYNTPSRSFNPPPRDSSIHWALNARRLNNDKGSVIALQERAGSIYVCVRKGETSNWLPYQKVLSQSELQDWISSGGFPKGFSR